ncbi:MAG: DNA polymerase III subunit alpha [Spirochaetales bacterium]|nr:MAG: DNA polymerase III subunit alpha [Spirochaetales bacterium]
MCDFESSVPPLLAARTHYSLMDGAGSPEDVCAFAAEGGYGAVALMDAGNLYGFPAFIDAAAKRGLKAIAGASFERGGQVYLRAWALTRRGYALLCALLSRSLAADPAHPYDPVTDLEADGWNGLAVASGSESVLVRLAASASVRNGRVCGWDRPFVALDSGPGLSAPARLARRLGLPTLAVAGGSLYGEDDADRLRLLAAIKRRITLSTLPGVSSWREPGSADEVPVAVRAMALFSAYPEAVEAARRLADEAEPAASFFSSPPAFPAWKGQPDEEAFRRLRSLCVEGALRRYPPECVHRANVSARLDRELAIIRSKGFSGYFLIVRDIVAACPRTCGRGSAASSIVSYLLGLTHVDPLEHDLFFERFLNEGRVDPPDIDIDFPWDERPAVLATVFRTYAGSSAMVADHCRFSGSSRIREPALAMGMDPDDLDKLTTAWRREGSQSLPPELARAAGLLKNVPRYIGTHPGGVVIVPGPITDYSHVQPGPAGFPILAWEKDGTERAGLVKIDLLGNRSLAVLRDCIELCSREADPPPDASDWDRFDPVNEPSARALIESGNTIGIFYIESPATRQLLAKMKVADYGHLVAASSIIRPAANRYINEYVRRLRGGDWKRLPEAVEACLAETYGIMVYQEDVSRVAMAAAGFSAVEADGLRKTLTKKRGSAKLMAFRERFMEGCSVNGASVTEAEELWSMMLSFDGYSFCKAHSASYALVSYRLAWMKANRPGYFMASVINNGGGFYGTQAYIDEAARLGYRVLPPRVNESAKAYEVRDDERCKPLAAGYPRGAIRAGLSQVRSASNGMVEAIVAGRSSGGPYRSVVDFLDRIKPSYDEFRAFVRAGCMDGLALCDGDGSPAIRPAMLWSHDRWRRTTARTGRAGELFSAWEAPACIADYSMSRKLADEADFLGVILSATPASLFTARANAAAKRLGWPRPSSSADMGRLLDRRISLVGVAVAGKEVLTAEGHPMCFRSFSDEAGVFECVIFPQAYKRLLPMLEENGAFLVLGRPRDDMGAVAVHVEDAASLNKSQR